MKKKTTLGIVLALLIAVVLLYHLVPRSFSQIMKESTDTDLAGVGTIDVLIIPLSQGGPEANYPLHQDDPAFQDLLDLLGSRRYAPLLGKPEIQYIYLDCQVFLSFDRAVCLEFSGDREMCFSSAKHNRFIRTGGSGEAFQQEILALLLDAAPSCEAAA